MESPGEIRRRETGSSRPVRVLFVNDHLGFPGGVTHGSTTYLSTVLPAFDRARIDARLCILRDRHPAAERFEAVGVPLVFLGRSKWDPRALSDLLALVRRWECDIVHLNGQKSHLLGRLAARSLDRKAIIHLHMLYEPKPRFLQPWLARDTAWALGVSEPLRRCAVEDFAMPPERTETLHNGIRLERFDAVDATSGERIRRELSIESSAPVIGVVGRITTTPDKGQRLAIEAMAAVRAEHPDAVMLIVGDGPARAACEARARELGLATEPGAAAPVASSDSPRSRAPPPPRGATPSAFSAIARTSPTCTPRWTSSPFRRSSTRHSRTRPSRGAPPPARSSRSVGAESRRSYATGRPACWSTPETSPAWRRRWAGSWPSPDSPSGWARPAAGMRRASRSSGTSSG